MEQVVQVMRIVWRGVIQREVRGGMVWPCLNRELSVWFSLRVKEKGIDHWVEFRLATAEIDWQVSLTRIREVTVNNLTTVKAHITVLLSVQFLPMSHLRVVSLC